jgi:Zn-dependent M28 family amino/carboxypeptidase
MADLKALADPAMGGRKLGSPGNESARTLIEERFTSLGLQPFGSSFRQTFTSPYGSGTNVIGFLPGTQLPDHYILLTAHFDHIGTKNGQIVCGADDNASGTATVLQFASYFKAHPTARTVVFCLFDGEEAGLLGSEAFASSPPAPLTLAKIEVVMNLDMIAQGTQGRIFVGGTTYSPALKPHLLAGFATSKVLVIPDFEAYDAYSDQSPFQVRGVPFLFFCVGDDDPYYHTPLDTFERIPQTFYWATTEAILATFLKLDEQASLPRQAAPARDLEPFERRWNPHLWSEKPLE